MVQERTLNNTDGIMPGDIRAVAYLKFSFALNSDKTFTWCHEGLYSLENHWSRENPSCNNTTYISALCRDLTC